MHVFSEDCRGTRARDRRVSLRRSSRGAIRSAAADRRPQIVPQIVRLSPAEAERLAREARQSVSGGDAARPRAETLGAFGTRRRSDCARHHRRRHGLRDEHEPLRPAARHSRPSGVVCRRPHAESSIDLNDFLRRELGPIAVRRTRGGPITTATAPRWRDDGAEGAHLSRRSSASASPTSLEVVVRKVSPMTSPAISPVVPPLYADDGLHVLVGAGPLEADSSANGDGLSPIIARIDRSRLSVPPASRRIRHRSGS